MATSKMLILELLIVVFSVCAFAQKTQTLEFKQLSRAPGLLKAHDFTDSNATASCECVDDTECDRGHMCDSETRVCVQIPQCEPWEGRENGHRHGDCIMCRSDTDCGWYKSKNVGSGSELEKENTYCWPDGVCRTVPPLFIMTFVKKKVPVRNSTAPSSDTNVVVEPASAFTRGQTMCASVIASAADNRVHLNVSITRIQICALKQTARLSRYRKDLKEKKLANKKKRLVSQKFDESLTQTERTFMLNEQELELEQQIAYPYDGIDPYDPLFHESTGCRTDKTALRVYTVYSAGKSSVADYHHFDAFEEVGLPGTSTVCFQALPISPRSVPVYMELEVAVSRSKDAVENKEEREQLAGLFKAFGLNNADSSSGKEQWNGLVPTSPNFKLFIGCPGGKEFDGVAGVCERPSVAKEMYFWVLLFGIVIMFAGIVVFFVEYNKAQQHLQ